MRVGCDEAGRGSVLGSMFIGCIRAEESCIPSDVKDSKKLTNNKINDLAEKLYTKDSIQVEVVEVSPTEIDNCDSLNHLTGEKMSSALNTLIDSKDDEVFVDCFSSNKQKATRQIRRNVDIGKITVEHKSDERYQSVRAASIIAKYSREKHINNTYGDIGSGYPSDKKTREYISKFVSNNGFLPPNTRESWKTAQDIIDEYE